MYRSAWALLSFLSLATAYTLQNVTIPSNSEDIQYYSVCSLHDYPACDGAWWRVEDPRFSDGSAMMCGDTNSKFYGKEPYFVYKFKGSAFYVYQWVNASTAIQLRLSDEGWPNSSFGPKDLPPEIANGSELQLVLAWKMEGLDPLQEHSIGMQHTATAGRNTFIVLDHLVITQTFLDENDKTSKRVSAGTIVGAVIGGILGAMALLLGLCWVRGWWNRRVSAKSNGGRYAWQGEPAATLKFVDPSTEIEASERIAREGRMEEEKERQRGGASTSTNSNTSPV